jgi:hypothetical protein
MVGRIASSATRKRNDRSIELPFERCDEVENLVGAGGVPQLIQERFIPDQTADSGKRPQVGPIIDRTE